jgi:small subunit ribosomal protein S5
MAENKEINISEKSEKNMDKETVEKGSPEKQLKEMTEIMDKKEEKEDERVSKEADKTFRAEERRGEFKRESREERFAREAQEKLDNWVPKTDLGKAVRSGKIKNIGEVFEMGKKIMEPQIVDLLIPGLRTDTLFIGQAKGKFGGGKRRAFRQTQKKTKEGNVLTFGVMAVVGDGKGHVGLGYGRSAETLPAKEKAIRRAKLNIVKISRGCASFDCSCEEPHSIPTVVSGKCSSVSIKLMPAPQGTGLVIGDEMKKILRAVGIRDIYSNSFGKVKTTFNNAKALMQALNKIGEVRT